MAGMAFMVSVERMGPRASTQAQAISVCMSEA